jgi:hypothetical protein
LAKSSKQSPGGNLGDYILTRVEEDPDSISSSLVLSAKENKRLDSKGRPEKDDKGVDLPPVWFPTSLHAGDIVDTGDAVDSLLSAGFEGLRNDVLLRGCAMLDEQFSGKSLDFVTEHLDAFVNKYLEHAFSGEIQERKDEAIKLQRDAIAIWNGHWG